MGRRRLGQHFLSDPTILDRIVAAIDPAPGDSVLEIGAGRGALTRRLAPKVGRVVAIERDVELAAHLAGSGKGEEGSVLSNVTMVQGDALELDWQRLLTSPASRFPLPAWKLIGNIPYYITTPLIEKALTPPLPGVIVFLVQLEVAHRLAAAPGSKAYGALSVGVQVAARVERLFTVRAGAFQPPPDVHSALVRLTPLARPLVPHEEHPALRAFVTAVFGQRRKQLARSVRSLTGLARPDVEGGLRALGASPSARAEVLTPQQFVELYRRFGR